MYAMRFIPLHPISLQNRALKANVISYSDLTGIGFVLAAGANSKEHLENEVKLRYIRELGYKISKIKTIKTIKTIKIYIHASNTDLGKVRSPLDGLFEKEGHG